MAIAAIIFVIGFGALIYGVRMNKQIIGRVGLALMVASAIIGVIIYVGREDSSADDLAKLRRNTKVHFPQLTVKDYDPRNLDDDVVGMATVENTGCLYDVYVTEVETGMVLVTGSESPSDDSILKSFDAARTGTEKCPSSPFN